MSKDTSKLDEKGHELLDDTPVAAPIHLQQHRPFDWVKHMIQVEMSRIAENHNYETFEEADDFDVGDDIDPKSPWEVDFDHATASGNPLQPPAAKDTPPAAGPAPAPASDDKPA